MTSEHVGELAELYALGTLEPIDAKRLEAHVRVCGSCATRVGEAEATVLHLIESNSTARLGADLPPLQLERRGASVWRKRAPSWSAIAAAFFIGLLLPGIFLVRDRAMQPGTPSQAAAVAMLAGHFGHVPLRARVAGAPKAKAIYPLEGGWIYVIAAAGPAVDVAVVRADRTSTVASLPASSAVRTAFATVDGKIGEVELLERGRIVAAGRFGR